MDNLSRVAIFIAVARHESFAAAARELGMTGSGVSKQVQNLELDLCTKLLNRTTRKVSLTEEGAIYYQRARQALDDLQEAADQINELKSLPRGNLRVSLPSTLGIQYLKGPIAAFALQYPEVTLDVQFEDRLIDIAEEGFDVVLRIAALEDSSMVARKLVSSPIHAYCSAEYLNQHGEPESPQDLPEHNVLAYTRNKGAHEWRYRDAAGLEAMVALHSNFKCDFADMMIEAACHGIGIIICPELFVRQQLHKKQLQKILPDYQSSPVRNLYAVFPPNRFVSTRLRLFVDHIQQALQQYAD